MIRVLAFAGGLAGAAGLSQFPEYSQQYIQRLSGAVDELETVVLQFDKDAVSVDMTREQALLALDGKGDIATARARSMRGTIQRYESLGRNLAALKDADVTGRALNLWRFTDTEVAQKAWADFKPAVPLTLSGLTMAGIGFLGGWTVLALSTWILYRLFRRRRKPAYPPVHPSGRF